ncbi:MAG TPA: hypothetical protein VMV07_10485 [Streptosporangiaceae bacterium]|nr:hypothetical protein [Streptosporangiaceae bacterium]
MASAHGAHRRGRPADRSASWGHWVLLALVLAGLAAASLATALTGVRLRWHKPARIGVEVRQV